MGRIFDPDNGFWSVVRKIMYMVELSLVWCVCSLPLVTMGTSASALYYTMVKVVRRERSYPLKEFFKAWKQNLKRGTILTIILAAVGCMSFGADIMLGAYVFELKNAVDYILCVLFLLKAIIFLGVICYVFPLLSRFDATVIKLLESALLLCIRHLPRTICVAILFCIAVILIRVESGLILIVPALFCLISSFLLEPVFAKGYEQQDIKENMDTWFAEN